MIKSFISYVRTCKIACVLFFIASCFLSVAQATKIENWQTTNHVQVFFVASHEIPMIDIRLDFNAGARFDSPKKSGVAGLVNAILDKGVGGKNGKALKEAEILDVFADVGANTSNGVSMDQASYSLRVLSDPAYSEKAIDLFACIVSDPTFPDDVLARDKKRTQALIREEMTRPESIANKAFQQALYGNHPYGQSATEASIEAITRDDLIAFYRQYYRADGAVLTLVGDIDRARAEQIAEKVTKHLQTQTQPIEKIADVASPKATMKRLDHPASQAHIYMGMPTLKRGDPDFFALLVGNYILGGGDFSSRLMNEVREKRGLSYSVYSHFKPMLQEGPFVIGLQTEKKQTDLAMKVVRETVTNFLKNGPTEAELQSAKSHLVNGFSLQMDTNRKILDTVATVGYYRLGLDYLDTWPDKVRAVTAEEVKQAMQRKLNIEKMSAVIVGVSDK